MPSVNSNILVWARKTAGLTATEAASKIRLNEVRLEKIEHGEEIPSESILLRMAKVYRRPAVTFYLEDIPAEANYGADFRGRKKEYTDKDQALVNALLRYAKSSQQLIRTTLELEEAIPLSFVGWLRQKWDLPQESKAMEHILHNMSETTYSDFIQDALDGLSLILGSQCTPRIYYKQPNKNDSFKLIRSSCERSGIFIILRNDLGSHHTKLSTDLFRAFVITDDIAPLMIINRSDSFPAKSLSILHETVHLLLDQTGISDFEIENPVEKFCSRVAGTWLLPLHVIKEELQSDITNVPEVISHISDDRKLSRMMVATRFYQEGLIQQEVYSSLMDNYRDDWNKSLHEKQKASKTGQQEGPSYYVTQRYQLGNQTREFANRMIQSGGLTVTKAAIILGVKPSNVFKLLSIE